MAYSSVTYQGDGSTLNFPFPFPYLDSEHIHAVIEYGDDEASNPAFGFHSASVLALASPVPAGAVLRIWRETPVDAPAVTFADASILKAADLNLLALYELYVAQETADRTARAEATANLALPGALEAVAEGMAQANANLAQGLAVAQATAQSAGQAAIEAANAAGAVAQQIAEAGSQAAEAIAEDAKEIAQDAKEIAQGIDAKAQAALDTAQGVTDDMVDAALAAVTPAVQAASDAASAAGRAKEAAEGIAASAQQGLEAAGIAFGGALDAANEAKGEAQEARDAALSAAGEAQAVSEELAVALEEAQNSVTPPERGGTGLTGLGEPGQALMVNGEGTGYTHGDIPRPADATNEAAGLVRIAKDAEASAGTLQTVAVNPKQLKAVRDAIPSIPAVPVGCIVALGEITSNTRYVVANPYPGYTVDVKVQVWLNNMWADPGFLTHIYSSQENGRGTRAGQISDGTIVVQTGNHGVATTANRSGGLSGYAGSNTGNATARLIVTRLYPFIG
jgi:hypothetical protein